MSEYNEIAEAVDAAYRRQESYEQEGQGFASRLVAAIEKYLQVPQGMLRVLPTEDADPEKMYAIPDAVKLGDDAHFHFLVRIELARGWVAVPVRFRKNNGAWDVTLGRNAATDHVDPRMEGHFAESVRELARTIKETLRTAFDSFLRGGGRPEARIGFDYSSE